MNKQEEDLLLVAVVMGRAIAEIDSNDLGGLMNSYDIALEVAREFCKKYPHDYDWEGHMESDGECWDMECFAFLRQYVKDKYYAIPMDEKTEN